MLFLFLFNLFLKAIELDFPLHVIHPEILLQISAAVSEEIQWKTAVLSWKESYQIPQDLSKTPINSAWPTEKISVDAYMFFTIILQFIQEGITISEFLRRLKMTPLSSVIVELIKERLLNTTVPPELIGNWSSNWCDLRF